jgi:hypothetical protein
MDPLTRIEHKLDALNSKLDNHLERISKAETAISWLKWALSVLVSLSGVAALALTKISDK